MKKRLSLILAILLIFTAFSPFNSVSAAAPTAAPTAAAPTASAPTATTPASAAPTALQQKVIDAFWLFTDEQHSMLVQVLNTYFNISDPASKQAFLVAYQDVITALAGYGDKIESFGLTAQILEKIDQNMSSGPNTTYAYFLNRDKAGFTSAIVANWGILESEFGTATLDRLAFGLNKVYPMTKRYVQLKDDPLVRTSMRVMGYTPSTNEISSLIDYNIRGLIGKANLWLNLSIQYSNVQPALQRMQSFYNSLSDQDKSLVFGTLSSQGMLFRRVQLGTITSSMNTLSGTVESGQMLRAFVGGQLLTPSGVNSDSSGAFTFSGFAPLSVGTVITVQAYAENGGNPQVLDEATVTVTAGVTPTQPVTTQPVTTQPVTTQPVTTQPVTTQPVTTQPVTTAPVTTQPTTQSPGQPIAPPAPLPTVATTTQTTQPTTTAPTVEIDDPDTALGGINFTDTLNFAWAREAIAKLSASGVIKGKSAQTFAPSDQITRAEFATMMTRLLKMTLLAANSDFKDVKPTAWFAREVRTVVANNLMRGLSSTSFNPTGEITRQEMATIMGRVLTLNKFLVKDQNILKQFADLSEIAAWAVGDVKLTVQEGILQGKLITNKDKTTKQVFAPGDEATRAEVAVALYRLSEKVPTVVKVSSSK